MAATVDTFFSTRMVSGLAKTIGRDLEVDDSTSVGEFIAHVEKPMYDNIKDGEGTSVYTPPVMVTYAQSLCVQAASIGRTDLLQAAYGSGMVKKSKEVFSAAARGGYFDCLKYLQFIDCPWDEQTVVAAVGSGDLNVVQWVVENGCPCSGEAMFTSASIGHLGMCSWLHDSVNPITTDDVREAVSSGATYIVEWALGEGVACSSVFSQAMLDGDICVLDELRRMRYPWDTDFVDKYAEKSDVDGNVVEWLRFYKYI